MSSLERQGRGQGHRGLTDIGESPEYVNNDAPVWLNNEEYFATDSGIGEDSQSLRSRGATTRGPRSASDDTDRLLAVPKPGTVGFHPRGNGHGNHGNRHLWSVSSSESNNGQVAMDNPEYMILHDSSSANQHPV